MHGVASGDPLADRVMLWTRVTPADPAVSSVDVRWTVALDPALARRVASGTVQTSAARDFTVKVDVIEWLGNEQYAYIPYDAPDHMVAGLAELERELDSERMRSQLVVALDPKSRIRDNSDATLWLDPRNMLIFDPQTRDNLTLSIEG
jgi:hypothetical protein